MTSHRSHGCPLLLHLAAYIYIYIYIYRARLSTATFSDSTADRLGSLERMPRDAISNDHPMLPHASLQAISYHEAPSSYLVSTRVFETLIANLPRMTGYCFLPRNNQAAWLIDCGFRGIFIFGCRYIRVRLKGCNVNGNLFHVLISIVVLNFYYRIVLIWQWIFIVKEID